jgi:hypothetical protein
MQVVETVHQIQRVLIERGPERDSKATTTADERIY